MARKLSITVIAALALMTMAFVPPTADAQICAPLDDGRISDVFYEGTVVFWQPRLEYTQMVLTVGGPCEDIVKVFGPKDQIFFDLGEIVRIPDGQYTWQLRRVAPVDPGVQEMLQEARGSGEEDALWWSLFQAGKIPEGPYVESGTFGVVEGQIVDPNSGTEKRAAIAPKAGGALAGASVVAGGALASPGDGTVGGNVLGAKDFVIIDDLIVDGSACIGFDCVNGESFGFDTIRLKENNLRIKFDDTSTAASFPRNDWQITVNDSANGGASKFSIDDISGSRTPFTIEANARSHSLYIDDGGRLGLRTSTPSTEIHTIDGDTPTLRLQQDGSSGFAPQTWDVAGNETNFFVRDVTNGSTLPFRIRPGAPSSAIVIDVDGDVGMGTASPDGDGLEIERGGSATQRILLRLKNAGAPQSEFENSDNAIIWRFGQNNAGDFVINDTADLGTAEMRITTGGAVYVNGGVVHPDYVFKPDYELMPLSELERFVKENRHLPNVQSASDREREGGVNITELPLRLLEKVEELTLYTLQQEKRIDDLSRQNAELVELVNELRSDLER